jgi:hypothetical protein
MIQKRRKPRKRFQLLRKLLFEGVLTDRKYQRIFSEVFYKYQRLFQHSIMQPVNLERGKSKSKGRTIGQVKPTRSDFIADVELAARKVLNKKGHQLFNSLLDTPELPGTQDFFIVAELLGKEFERRGIYPVDEYMRGKRIIPIR